MKFMILVASLLFVLGVARADTGDASGIGPVIYAPDSARNHPAYAHRGAYIGIGAGSSDIDIGSACGVLTPPCSGSLDSHDSGYKAFVGYRFFSTLAAEAFYADFGDAKTTGTNGTDSLTESSSVKGYGGSIVLLIPASDSFDLFTSLGLIRWSMDTSIQLTGTTNSSTNENKTGVDAIFGFGAQYTFGSGFGVRAEFDTFEPLDAMSTGTVGRNRVQLLSGSVFYRF